MVKTARHIVWIIAIALLLFNAAGAWYGGLNLVMHPDGSSIGLDINLINKTAFGNYFLPGIILILLHGIIDLFVLAATIYKIRHYALLILAQGFVLLCWLLIQITVIRIVDQMHYIMGTTAALFIISGLLLNYPKTKKT